MADRARVRRGRRFLVAMLLALVGGLLTVEVGFRWILFTDGAGGEVGASLRHAALYADSTSDDDFWKLFYELDKGQSTVPDEIYHPELGWVSSDLDARTLRHAAAGRVGARRPVLLYGDSYARCMGKRRDCFEWLLEESALGERFALLNHGVPGYGLDQTYLLLERTVDAYADARPVVVVALQVDDGLDRTALAIRGWPKPRLTIRDGALVPETPVVPRMEDYLRDEPVTFPSYAWRYLQFGTRLVPLGVRARVRGEDAIVERKRTTSRRILEEIRSSLERRGVEHFFLFFHGEAFVDGSRPPDWRDELLREFLRESGAPSKSARRAILADARATGKPVSSYFSQLDDATLGHLVPDGNRAVLNALLEGLEGRYDEPGS